MIELVFVIVVLGILASLAMGRMDRDLRQEAASTILSHIRLAQQLALNDNKHRSDNDTRWQRAYWNIHIRPCRNGDWSYRVSSNTGLDNGGPNANAKQESAINPIDGKYLWSSNCDNLASNESPVVHLSKKFGISNVEGCRNRQIAFDYLGRTHTTTAYNNGANFENIMTNDCNLTFTLSTDVNNDGEVNNNDNFIITIKAETGHAFIVGQEDL